MKKHVCASTPFLILILLLSFTGCKKKDVPVLDTLPVTQISGNSAISGGNITYDGGETVIERGVCWSKNIKPVITETKTSDGAGAGSFSSNISNLLPATNYYLRAYATTSSGTGYGMVLSFTTLGEVPTATTQTASNITTTSASVSSSVNANYISTIVTFEYGISTSYGNSVSATQSPVTGSSGSMVSADITGLTAGTIYHFRVKAENSLGITFGNDMTFTTLGQVPTASTQAASNVLVTSATLKGMVNANNLSTTVTFEYGTSTSYGSTIGATQSPVTGNSLTAVSASVSGLTEGLTYHFSVKAGNSLGFAYGNDLTFVPANPLNQVTDVEGNVYSAVEIGTQIWMAENLKTTLYNDNSSIPLVTDNSAWIALSTAGYCWYNNDAATYKNTYGALYNWYAASSGKLCPAGWHVPSDAEFTTLANFLGGSDIAGGKMKEAGTFHWLAPNTGATNESSFTALPAGQRDDSGNFIQTGLSGEWWSTTVYNIYKSWYHSTGSTVSLLYRGSGILNQRGFSIRCIKD